MLRICNTLSVHCLSCFSYPQFPVVVMYLIFTTPSTVKETTLASSTRLPQMDKSQNSKNVAVTVALTFGAVNDYSVT